MKIAQVPNGDYYVFDQKASRFDFTVKATPAKTGVLFRDGTIFTPPELVGKKIRLKIEMIEVKPNE